MPAQPPRVILHLDMDAFYAAVEVREDLALAGLPLIIGHRGRRGVVSTCSYEARRFGVHSAMPSVTAERLCPDAIWLPGRMELYVQVSRRIRSLMDEVSPVVEPLSIDEAFLDLTGITATLAGGAKIARRLKERIQSEESLSASVGVAPNKFLAKLASDMDKPDGLVLLPHEEVPARLWPLPVERLWGVGPKTAARLKRLRVKTVGEILELADGKLAQHLGENMAAHLQRLARGDDERPVESRRERKSISEERTYARDLRDADVIDQALLARAEGVSRSLRGKGLVARTVQLKVRTGDFTTWTRSRTLPEPTDLTEPIVSAARELLARRIQIEGRGVRLLGVGVSGLAPCKAGQASLFSPPPGDPARRLARAIDAVRSRYGEDAVTRARLRRHRNNEDEDEASSLPAVD